MQKPWPKFLPRHLTSRNGRMTSQICIYFIKRHLCEVRQQESAPQQAVQATTVQAATVQIPATTESKKPTPLQAKPAIKFCSIIRKHNLTVSTSNGRQSGPLLAQPDEPDPWALEVVEFSYPPFQISPCHCHSGQVTYRTSIDRGGGTNPTPEASSEETQLQHRGGRKHSRATYINCIV